MPSSPKALPLFFASTEDAMRASRGAEREPAPSRSRNRAPSTPCQMVERPISGLAIADKVWYNRPAQSIFAFAVCLTASRKSLVRYSGSPERRLLPSPRRCRSHGAFGSEKPARVRTGTSIEDTRELIEVPQNQQAALRFSGLYNPEDAAGIERVLKFRKRVADEFERQVRLLSRHEHQRDDVYRFVKRRIPKGFHQLPLARPNAEQKSYKTDQGKHC